MEGQTSLLLSADHSGSQIVVGGQGAAITTGSGSGIRINL
jgi:hypothetical protein